MYTFHPPEYPKYICSWKCTRALRQKTHWKHDTNTKFTPVRCHQFDLSISEIQRQLSHWLFSETEQKSPTMSWCTLRVRQNHALSGLRTSIRRPKKTENILNRSPPQSFQYAWLSELQCFTDVYQPADTQPQCTTVSIFHVMICFERHRNIFYFHCIKVLKKKMRFHKVAFPLCTHTCTKSGTWGKKTNKKTKQNKKNHQWQGNRDWESMFPAEFTAWVATEIWNSTCCFKARLSGWDFSLYVLIKVE